MTQITLTKTTTVSALARVLNMQPRTFIKQFNADEGVVVKAGDSLGSLPQVPLRRTLQKLKFELKYVSVEKTVSKNPKGLTLLQLENEIFDNERIRVVFRATNPAVRCGAVMYGQMLPAGSAIEHLTKRLNGYFNRLEDGNVLSGISYAIVGPDGKVHLSTRSPKVKLDSVRFMK